MSIATTFLSRSGTADWLIQRISALVLAAYTLCIAGFVIFNPDMTHTEWQAFFSHLAMQLFTLLALIATCAHAWVGLWIVGSDYLSEHLMSSAAGKLVRKTFQLASALIIIAYLLWGIKIIWSN